MNAPQFRRAGFTLIELLVSVAVIGILAALTTPALSQVKQRARRTVCLNHLKQLAAATAMYQGDHEDRYPPTFALEDDGIRQTNWFQFTASYHGSDKILRCPVPPGKGRFDRMPPLTGRYAANFRLGWCQWPGTTWSHPPLAGSAVQSPATTVHLTDSGTVPQRTADPRRAVAVDSPRKTSAWILDDPVRETPCAGCVTSELDPNWGGPDPRHDSRSVNAFADGHVQAMRAQEWYWGGTSWLDPTGGPH